MVSPPDVTTPHSRGPRTASRRTMKLFTQYIVPLMVVLAGTAILTAFVLARLHNPQASPAVAVAQAAKQPEILIQPYDTAELRLTEPAPEQSTDYTWVTGVLCLVGFIGILIFSSKHHGDIIRFEEQLPKNRRGKPRRKWRSTAGLERATRTSRIGKRISFLTVLGSAIFGIIAFFIERV